MKWLAEELPTNIGTIDKGWLSATTSGGAGYLSFGPYVALPVGKYRFTIDYRSALSSESIAGHYDAVSAQQAGRNASKYASGELAGTDNQMTTIGATINIVKGDGPLEIRTTFSGKGELKLHRISISPDPANLNWAIAP